MLFGNYMSCTYKLLIRSSCICSQSYILPEEKWYEQKIVSTLENTSDIIIVTLQILNSKTEVDLDEESHQ